VITRQVPQYRLGKARAPPPTSSRACSACPLDQLDDCIALIMGSGGPPAARFHGLMAAPFGSRDPANHILDMTLGRLGRAWVGASSEEESWPRPAPRPSPTSRRSSGRSPVRLLQVINDELTEIQGVVSPTPASPPGSSSIPVTFGSLRTSSRRELVRQRMTKGPADVKRCPWAAFRTSGSRRAGSRGPTQGRRTSSSHGGSTPRPTRFCCFFPLQQGPVCTGLKGPRVPMKERTARPPPPIVNLPALAPWRAIQASRRRPAIYDTAVFLKSAPTRVGQVNDDPSSSEYDKSRREGHYIAINLPDEMRLVRCQTSKVMNLFMVKARHGSDDPLRLGRGTSHGAGERRGSAGECASRNGEPRWSLDGPATIRRQS